ncbi:MAG: NAD(P)-dependent alcohol dehydrogenase [Steroidobacteraceae bacterium]
MRVFEVLAGSTSLDGLRAADRPQPTAAPRQILVRMQAASLNYRDLMLAKGHYGGGPVRVTTIPLSDGVGEVVSIGSEVTRFRVGDRVAGTFFRDWSDGPPGNSPHVAIGAPPADGVLAEYAVFDEQDAVAVPSHLSAEAAATLPCAGVTAWRALVDFGRVAPGETVLLIGTGGVSIFALQFARLAGARALIISSSDAKLARARALGAEAGINYRTTPDWEREVVRSTGGIGVNHIIEVGGAGTLGRSMDCLAVGGRIALIGVLTGNASQPSPYPLLRKQASVQGVFVGSRGHFERMNAAVAGNRLEPVVDRVFPFDQAPEAYRYLESGVHFGKVVVRF